MSLRYSANIGFLWDHLPLPERIARAATAGFDAVECHFPYEYATGEINSALDSADLPMVGLNTALGPAGSFGLASIEGQETAARQLIDQAIDYAISINAGYINVVAGLSAGQARAQSVYIENLAYACECAKKHGKMIVIEALNHRAVPDYHFNSVVQAVDIIDQVGADNLKLMFDVFHAQIVDGDIETLITDYVSYFGHVQISAVHDRGEPDQGEINFAYVLTALEAAGYTGYVGAEYKPRGADVESGLSWLEQFRRL